MQLNIHSHVHACMHGCVRACMPLLLVSVIADRWPWSCAKWRARVRANFQVKLHLKKRRKKSCVLSHTMRGDRCKPVDSSRVGSHQQRRSHACCCGPPHRYDAVDPPGSGNGCCPVMFPEWHIRILLLCEKNCVLQKGDGRCLGEHNRHACSSPFKSGMQVA